MGYKIAFDPSIAHIGYCIFEGGTVVDIGTLNRPEKHRTYHAKLEWVASVVHDLCCDVLLPLGSTIEKVVIEDFQAHTKHPTKSLLKLAAAQGVIFAMASWNAQSVFFLNKGKAKKEEAQLLAKHAGLKCDEHGADAYHLGILAGFDHR